MRSLHDKSFFRAWDAIYSASNPRREKDRWTVDGVLWIKDRHAYWGGAYSVQLEIHQLEMQERSRSSWKLLVIIERWWGPDKTACIRDQFWCKLISGRAEAVRVWMQKNANDADSAMAG